MLMQLLSKSECLLNNNQLWEKLVCKAAFSQTPSEINKYYCGTCEKTFKEWYNNHTGTFRNKSKQKNMENTSARIYPSSFTNVCFSTKIEFSKVMKCRWGSQGAVSSATDSWQSIRGEGGSGDKVPEKFWPFSIWRSNK